MSAIYDARNDRLRRRPYRSVAWAEERSLGRCQSADARIACARRLRAANAQGIAMGDPEFPLPACGPATELRMEQRQRVLIQQAFSRYVDAGVVAQVIADPARLNLGGETRMLTIMFADIRGFTRMAETMKDTPQQLNRVTNAVLGPLSDVIVAHGGTIDKYIGDCVMAFWGAPAPDPDHAWNAVVAAQHMLGALGQINADIGCLGIDADDVPEIRIGIGVNSGECLVGNLGSRDHFNYSVLGDPVNVAARLVGLSKHYGSDLLVGESTAELLPASLQRRELDQIAPRGRVSPLRVYSL